MHINRILIVSGITVLLGACSSSQSQIEGSAPAVASTGSEHIHNVQGHGDISHSHQGNSTASHGHSWAEIQKELKP